MCLNSQKQCKKSMYKPSRHQNNAGLCHPWEDVQTPAWLCPQPQQAGGGKVPEGCLSTAEHGCIWDTAPHIYHVGRAIPSEQKHLELKEQRATLLVLQCQSQSYHKGGGVILPAQFACSQPQTLICLPLHPDAPNSRGYNVGRAKAELKLYLLLNTKN